MKVQQVRDLGNGHSIEIGISTWSDGERSIRDRYATSTGGFSPRSSSEVPMDDLVPMLEFAAQHDELSVAQCARTIAALSMSIQRRTT
jgi:hypothetical protein